MGDTPGEASDELAFERKLYVIRKRVEYAVDAVAMSAPPVSFVIPTRNQARFIRLFGERVLPLLRARFG